MKKIEGSTAQ